VKKLVLMMTLGVIFLDAGAAFAGAPARPIPNPGTLVLFTTGIAGLAWWLRKRD
jgi:hypothetical protein